MDRQQVHLQQTVPLRMEIWRTWFTPAKESIGPQRSLASSSCTTVCLMHSTLKPMRCLNHYLLLWWNGPEILRRWTGEALVSGSCDQLDTSHVANTYLVSTWKMATMAILGFSLHTFSSEDQDLTAPPHPQLTKGVNDAIKHGAHKMDWLLMKAGSGGLARSPSSLRKRLQRPQPGMTWRYNSMVINWPFPSDTRLPSVSSVVEKTRSLQKESLRRVWPPRPRTEEAVSLRCPQEWLQNHCEGILQRCEGWKRAYWRRFQLGLKKANLSIVDFSQMVSLVIYYESVVFLSAVFYRLVVGQNLFSTWAFFFFTYNNRKMNGSNLSHHQSSRATERWLIHINILVVN